MDEKKMLELNDDALDMVSGGEYGDLLTPVGPVGSMVCSVCGKAFESGIHRIKGKAYCSDCWAQQSSQGE